ncbi:MAG: hypothetical protein EOR51_29085 [Mesorhizobium sp.]|nr:MAG: hypothetical protein EOR51_29085 [Mesorhizobium sp.]RWL06241.1 MAG: hypothetical protein EOR56_28550 [Mesorhizobium sp.]
MISETGDESVLLPVTIRGEVPGRAMRGSAEIDKEAAFPGRIEITVRPSTLSGACAAPHPPAGTFSPYSDGEKGYQFR